MGDAWDYRLRKVEMAWELALRIIPDKPQPNGAWTEGDYLKKAQETLKEANAVIDAVFKSVTN